MSKPLLKHDKDTSGFARKPISENSDKLAVQEKRKLETLASSDDVIVTGKLIQFNGTEPAILNAIKFLTTFRGFKHEQEKIE